MLFFLHPLILMMPPLHNQDCMGFIIRNFIWLVDMQNIAKTCQNKKQNPVRTQFSAASDLNPLPSATEVADLEGDTSRRGLDDG